LGVFSTPLFGGGFWVIFDPHLGGVFHPPFWGRTLVVITSAGCLFSHTCGQDNMYFVCARPHGILIAPGSCLPVSPGGWDPGCVHGLVRHRARVTQWALVVALEASQPQPLALSPRGGINCAGFGVRYTPLSPCMGSQISLRNPQVGPDNTARAVPRSPALLKDARNAKWHCSTTSVGVLNSTVPALQR
jgi:hypothetical protein